MEQNFESYQKKLFRKYLDNECSREELVQLFEYLQQSDDRQEYREVLEDLWKQMTAYKSMNPVKADEIFKEIVDHPRTSIKMS